MLRVFRVRGNSMLPRYRDGDLVLTCALPRCLLRAGTAVVVATEADSFVIKRIHHIINKRLLQLSSDNKNTDSVYCRHPIARAKVTGAVIFSI